MPFKLLLASLGLLGSMAMAQTETLDIHVMGIRPEARTCSVRTGPCKLSSDCCGDMYCDGANTCQGGTFCQPRNAPCRGTHECCAGLYCDNTGTCH